MSYYLLFSVSFHNLQMSTPDSQWMQQDPDWLFPGTSHTAAASSLFLHLAVMNKDSMNKPTRRYPM